MTYPEVILKPAGASPRLRTPPRKPKHLLRRFALARRRNPHLIKIIAIAPMVFLACALGAQAGTLLVFPNLGTAVLFPPYAFLAAALILSPARYWWIYILAATLGNFGPHFRYERMTSFVLLAESANILRALIAAAGIRWLAGITAPFDTLRDTITYLLFAVVIGPAIAGLVGAVTVAWHNPSAPFWPVWQAWTLSNTLTAVTLLPLILKAPTLFPLPRNVPLPRLIEGAAIALGMAIVGIFIFNGPASDGVIPYFLYLPLPFLIWAAVRFGTGGMILSLSTLAAFTITGTLSGRGPFVTRLPGDNLLQLQYFLIAFSIPLLLLGAIVREQRRTSLALLLQQSALGLARERNFDLTKKLLSAQETERSRIAAELHDDVSQQLAAMAIALSTLKRHFPEANPERSDIEALQHEAGQLAKTVRLLSHDLHPSTLEHIGLVAALRSRCLELSRKSGISILFDCPDESAILNAAARICLFRIAQEALHNTIRHADACHVRVELRLAPSRAVLAISDDGCGFDSADSAFKAGLGFITMEERARIAGGKLEIRSKPSHGTTIHAEIPMTP